MAPKLLPDVAFLNLSSQSQRLCFPIKCVFELPCPDLTRSFRQLIFPRRIILCYVVVCVVLSYSSLDAIFVCGFTHLCDQMFFLAQPLFLNIFFWCDLPHLAVFIIFVSFFCHQVVHLFHLVFRQSQDSNPRPRTMARIVSPQRSPLDQGASLINSMLPLSILKSCRC